MKYLTYSFRLLLLILPLSGFAQLDTSFNHNGMILVTTGLGAAEDIVIQPDGHIIVLGSFQNQYFNTYITSFRTDGTLDTGFLNNVTNINYNFSFHIEGVRNDDAGGLYLFGAAVDNDGTDSATADFAFVKLHDNGTLDSSFGNSGVVITDLAYTDSGIWKQGNDDYALDLAVQPGGKVILYGKTSSLGEDKLAWVRYLADGSMDSTFGEYGIKVQPVPNSLIIYPMNVAVLPDGRIVSGFIQHLFTPAYTINAVRLRPNGTLDSSYNQTGIASNPHTVNGFKGIGSSLQSEGSVIEVGYSNPSHLALMTRFDSSGNRDATFGINGEVEIPFAELADMAVTPDGKIMLLGSLDTCFVLYRYLPDGQPDQSFGTGGKFTSRLLSGSTNYQSKSLALQPDGRIIAGGALGSGGSPISYVLARYFSDGKTGIAEIPKESRLLQIYPSPAKDKLNIRWQGSQPQRCNVSVYDVSGRLLWQKENQIIDNQPFDVDVSAFAAGIYLINISNDRGLDEKRKFVKE